MPSETPEKGVASATPNGDRDVNTATGEFENEKSNVSSSSGSGKKDTKESKSPLAPSGKGKGGQTTQGESWTIMRPLRMKGLKSREAPHATFPENDDGRPLKTTDSKNTASTQTGVGEVEVLSSDSARATMGGHDTGHDGGRDASADLEGDLGQREYRVYKRRWFGLVQIVLLNILVSWDWLSFAASSTTASLYYNVSPTAINWLSTSFMFAFVMVSPVVLFTLHRGGPKSSILAASILLLLGNWIRYGATRAGAHGNFGGVMFGQILTGFAQAFVLSAPTRYSDLWFSNRGRVAATAVMSLANPLGGAVAQLVGPEIAKKPGDIPLLVLIVAIVATIASLPSFFLPAAPPTPSSPSSNTPKQDILPSLRALFTSPEFYMVFIPFATYIGLFNSLSSLINQFLQPYSFTETQAGIAGALLIVVGLVATAISSPIIDRTKSHLLALKILTPIVGLCYLTFTFAPASRSELAPYIILAVLGASSFATVPVVLEFMIEISHPISPEITSTISWTGGQVLGGILIIVSGELRAPGRSDGTEDDGSSRPPANMYRALILQTVFAMLVVPLPLCLGLFGRKEQVLLRRVEADRAEAEARASAVSS